MTRLPALLISLALSFPAHAQTVMGRSAFDQTSPEVMRQIGPLLVDAANPYLGNYAGVVASLQGADPLTQMDAVNRTVNHRISYSDLPTQWRTASAVADLTTGNCKDYTVMKMALLHKLGFPLSDMSILVVKPDNGIYYHAVLLVKFYGITWVLDNASSVLVEHAEIDNYTPLYAVSTDGMVTYGG